MSCHLAKFLGVFVLMGALCSSVLGQDSPEWVENRLGEHSVYTALFEMGPLRVAGLELDFKIRPVDEALPLELDPPEKIDMRHIVVDRKSGQTIAATSLYVREVKSGLWVARVPIYVHRDFRKRGVGEAVKRVMTEYAFRVLKVDLMEGLVESRNSASLALHLGLGFKILETIEERRESIILPPSIVLPAHHIVLYRSDFKPIRRFSRTYRACLRQILSLAKLEAKSMRP